MRMHELEAEGKDLPERVGRPKRALTKRPFRGRRKRALGRR
jgi:hypothetical protein